MRALFKNYVYYCGNTATALRCLLKHIQTSILELHPKYHKELKDFHR